MMSDWISLDVGGLQVSTARSTLCSSPDSVLARMFDPNSGLPPARMEEGRYCIDADPRCFQVILNWLRRRVIVIENIPSELLLAEVEYWGLEEMAAELRAKVSPQISHTLSGKWESVARLGNSIQAVLVLNTLELDTLDLANRELENRRGAGVVYRLTEDRGTLRQGRAGQLFHRDSPTELLTFPLSPSQAKVQLVWIAGTPSNIPQTGVTIGMREGGPVFLGRPKGPDEHGGGLSGQGEEAIEDLGLGYILPGQGLISQTCCIQKFLVLCAITMDIS